MDGEGATGRRRAPASLADGGTPAGFGGALAQSSLVSRIFGDRPSTDGEINFAQMMEYLVNKRVLRLLIYDSGKTAIGALRERAPLRVARKPPNPLG